MQNNEQMPTAEEYDYNREAPLDRRTVSENRKRSKYVFMTLCFLLALLLFYTYLNHTFDSDSSSDWFPLIGGIVLVIMGIIFWRSPDEPPQEETDEIAQSEEETTLDAEMPLSAFEELVQEALIGIPTEFQEQMENVVVNVAHQPDAEVLERAGVKAGYTLLGLYEGVPLTAYGRLGSSYPEVITIYQQPIEAHCQHDPDRIRAQVRSTVLHEVAHHFGMGHEEMPIWIK